MEDNTTVGASCGTRRVNEISRMLLEPEIRIRWSWKRVVEACRRAGVTVLVRGLPEWLDWLVVEGALIVSRRLPARERKAVAVAYLGCCGAVVAGS